MKNHMFLKTPVESLALAGHITFNKDLFTHIPTFLLFVVVELNTVNFETIDITIWNSLLNVFY